MKVQFKLNGVKVEKNIPACWDDVTFRQLLAFTKAKDEAEVLSVFTGIDPETIRKSKISNLPTLLALLSFLKNQPIDYTLPKTIMGYPVNEDVEIQEIERYAALENILKKFKDGDPANLEYYPAIVSTYCCDLDKDLSDYFMDAPAMEVLAVANFTQVNIHVLSVITPIIARLAALPRNNWKQVMSGYIMRLAFSVSFYFLKRRLPPPVRRYLNGRFMSLKTLYAT